LEPSHFERLNTGSLAMGETGSVRPKERGRTWKKKEANSIADFEPRRKDRTDGGGHFPRCMRIRGGERDAKDK